MIGRLTFELEKFDNNLPSRSIETIFKAKLTIDDSKDRKNQRKMKYSDSECDTNDEDIEELEALLAKRFHRGKGKYKGKMPIICFNCHEVGYIAARFPKEKNRDEKYGDKYKRRRDDDDKSYKNEGKKSCYIAEKDSDDESRNSEEVEVV